MIISDLLSYSTQASELTHYLIALSEDVAPLQSVSVHLRIATYDLIPEVGHAPALFHHHNLYRDALLFYHVL